MTSSKIHVCVLEGHQAELASAGLPLSVCMRLQELGLPMSAAQWSTRQTITGFSVSFFWPSSRATVASQLKPRNKRRRRRKRKRVPTVPNTVVSASTHDHPPTQGSHSPPLAANTPTNAHQPTPVQGTEVPPVPKSPEATVTDCATLLNVSNSSSSSGTSVDEPPSSSAEDDNWTVVSPKKRLKGPVGPRVPAPYFRMPSQFWPDEIKKKYLHTRTAPVPAKSVCQSPISSRTRAKTSTT